MKSPQPQLQLELPISLDELRKTLKIYGVTQASLFGSFARGAATPQSDIDLLVKLVQVGHYGI